LTGKIDAPDKAIAFPGLLRTPAGCVDGFLDVLKQTQMIRAWLVKLGR